MAESGLVQAWKTLVEKNIFTPLAWDRQREASDDNAPFAIVIRTVEGITHKEEPKTGTEYRLRLSFFDLTYKHFFGRTWHGSAAQAKVVGQKKKILYNQNVYFHTSLHDTSIAVVLELVAESHVGDGKMQQVSCGWGFFRPFKQEGDMSDLSSAAAALTQKVKLYQGSPRALLYLDEPVEESKLLTLKPDSIITCSIQTHRHLARIMHLIPENVFVSQNDVVPGVADPPGDGKSTDPFRKPRQLKALPCYLEKLSINLTPSVEKLEEELCRLLNEDHINRENKVADGTSVSIMERRLQIGVHNGWCYVDKPEVIHLGGDGGGMKGSSLRRSMRGHQRTPSSSSLNAIGSLIHRNRVQLDGMVQDPSMVVVFVLEYVLGEPVADKRTGMAKSTASTVAVRWAAWSPFANMQKEDNKLVLLGGPDSIPDSVLVFNTAEPTRSLTNVKGSTSGTIHFEFKLQNKQAAGQQATPESLSAPSHHDVPALNLPTSARAPSQQSLVENGELQSVAVPGRPPIPASVETLQAVTRKPPPVPVEARTNGSVPEAMGLQAYDAPPVVPPRRATTEPESSTTGYLSESSKSQRFGRSQSSTMSRSQKGASGLSSSGYQHLPQSPHTEPYSPTGSAPPPPLTPAGHHMYPGAGQVFAQPPPATSPSPYGAAAAGSPYGGLPYAASSPYPGVGPYAVAPLHHPSPRSYIPVEITHVRDQMSPMHSARSMPGDLHELPFTPVHAPIMATAPGRHTGQGLSRAAYAKLYTAGFPPILDNRGEPPEVVDPADHLSFVLSKEETDKLQANEIIFQLLAYSRMTPYESVSGTKQPGTVFFTFQFYRFPQVTTERLMLGTAEGDLSADPHALPCLLQKLAKDGTVLQGPPGYQVKYHVDPAFLAPGEGRLFVQHLSQQTLHMDVWDGDSLLLIGSCAVDLKHLARQGRGAVQVSYELDVISTEYVEADLPVPAGDMTRDGVVRPVDVRSILKGRLHIRMANIGHPADAKLTRTERGTLGMKPKTVIYADTGVESRYSGGSLGAPPTGDHASVLRKTRVAKAAHMAEVDHELASLLYGRAERAAPGSSSSGGHRATTNQAQQRKLSRMSAVRQTEAETPQVISSYRAEKEERSRDLKTINLYRSQHKREGILNMLNAAITCEHTLHPSLGTIEFFEFSLRNPYNVEHTVIIETDDPELIVVTDPREWRHLKMLNEIYTPIEEGMFNTDTSSAYPEVFLRPKESVNVPFKFLTFKADHSVSPQAPSNPFMSAPKTKSTPNHMKKTSPLDSRVIKVFFKTQDNKPIAILSLKVEPQPHIIDQTFRFHHPEQSFLKKSIRLPPLNTLPGIPIGGAGVSQVFVRCSDPNVICESRQVQQGEPHDVFIKVACGASPQVKKFFVVLYSDAFLSRPLQVWQVYVHALQRVDVAAIEGQTSRFTLVLRGTQASRLVQCFSSHEDELAIEPQAPFMLAAGALHEIHVGLRPLAAGTRFLYINVVDMEYHQAVRSWLVCVTCRSPVVTKAYELSLPVGGGKGSNKRIAYTNPYPTAKVFHLRSNHDDLLQFKDTRLEVPAGQTTSIGLRFAPSQAPGTAEILVFINDEDDKNEETFCVRATYQ